MKEDGVAPTPFILDKQKFLTIARNIIVQSTISTTYLVINTLEYLSERLPLWKSIPRRNDVIGWTYSDVPLLAKVNLFIRRSELTYSPATYIIYLISLVI